MRNKIKAEVKKKDTKAKTTNHQKSTPTRNKLTKKSKTLTISRRSSTAQQKYAPAPAPAVAMIKKLETAASRLSLKKAQSVEMIFGFNRLKKNLSKQKRGSTSLTKEAQGHVSQQILLNEPHTLVKSKTRKQARKDNCA